VRGLARAVAAQVPREDCARHGRRYGTRARCRATFIAIRCAEVPPDSSATVSGASIQVLVFALVTATFATIYITQPVLPIIEREFGVGATTASLTVSAVILGIALSNLPFGVLADRVPVQRLILAGAAVVASTSLVCAVTHRMGLLIGARFVQGLFIPSMSTCLAAYLARTLPPARLNVVMGSYVSASVAGGLGGRLLGGFIHPPLHWRYAFVTAGALLVCAALASVRWLPPDEPAAKSPTEAVGFFALLRRGDLLRLFAVGFAGFFVFSAMFNYLPFYLSGPPLRASLHVVTLLYLAYVVGIVMGPISGKLSNRIGAGPTLVLGSLLFAAAIALTLVPSLPVIAVALAGLCGGFFAIHASAVGALNRRLTASRGRANSLYVLLYYLGGAAGISASGAAYVRFGWKGAAALGVAALAVPFSVGLAEIAQQRTHFR
jgi:YNFM family putative membrane transporter